MEFGGVTAAALYVLYSFFFLSVCHFSSRRLAVHAAIYKYSSPTTFRCQRLQNLSQILQCQMPCTYSMNNVKPQRLFSFGSVFVTESVSFPRCPSVRQLRVVEMVEIKTKRLYFTQNSELCLFLCNGTQKMITELGKKYNYIYVYMCVYTHIYTYIRLTFVSFLYMWNIYTYKCCVCIYMQMCIYIHIYIQ